MNKNIIIFDIDGVLADCTHRLHYIEGEQKDWDAFYKACVDDKPIPAGATMLSAILLANDHRCYYDTYFFTGRPESSRDMTLRWFHDKLDITIESDTLFMRKDGDYREDYVIKREMLENAPFTKDDVLMVFEDRQQVVDMWRSLGITCYQTQKGDY